MDAKACKRYNGKWNEKTKNCSGKGTSLIPDHLKKVENQYDKFKSNNNINLFEQKKLKKSNIDFWVSEL